MTSSPQPQMLKPLPPPGVSTYHLPMLWDQAPHLDSSIAPQASAAFTPSAHRVDSHCEVTKPSSSTNLIDASTQTDLEISPENAENPKINLQNSQKIPENSQKISEHTHSTSYSDIHDPTLHVLALTLPFHKEHESNLTKLIYLDDWERWELRMGWISPCTMSSLPSLEIMNPHCPHPQEQL